MSYYIIFGFSIFKSLNFRLSSLEAKVTNLIFFKNQTELLLEDLKENMAINSEQNNELLSEELKLDCEQNKRQIGRIEQQQLMMVQLWCRIFNPPNHKKLIIPLV